MLIVGLVVITLNTGCATITRGTTQNVAVDTNPQQATVTTNSGPGCTSPCTLDLKRNMGHIITATKTGYKPKTAAIRNEISGGGAAGMIGNAVFGGIVGVAVDAASGAAFDLYPAKLTLMLDKEEEDILTSAR